MELMRHQLEGVNRAMDGPCAFFWDCGTGKTCLGLTIIDQLQRFGYGPAVVLCPLSIIKSAWIEDAAKFTPHLSIANLWYESSAKKTLYQKKLLKEKHDIFILNYETFRSLYKDIKAIKPQVMIVDESSKIKSIKAKTTKAVLSFAGLSLWGAKKLGFDSDYIIPWRYCLTGTPAPNDNSEYWPQVKFITGIGNNSFNDNYTAFRSRYFFMVDIGNMRKIPKFQKSLSEDFRRSMSPYVHVVRTEDVLDLPETIDTFRLVKLNSQEKRAYCQMLEQYVVNFGDKTIISPHALTQMLSLREITSGFIYDDKKNICWLGKSKLNELKGLLEEIGNHKVIIWFNFDAEKQAILQMLESQNKTRVNNGLKSISFAWADKPGKTREMVIENFKTGSLQYMLANPASLGHGLTLIKCRYNIFYSISHSYEDFQQAKKRTHRKGQTANVHYVYILADGTYDQAIYKSVQNKHNLSTGVAFVFLANTLTIDILKLSKWPLRLFST